MKRVSVRQCLYVISNAEAIFESQLIKKLSNSEAESKKALLIKKACSSPKAIPINKTKIKSFSSMSSQLEAHSQSPFYSE